MIVTPLTQDLIPAVERLLALGEPYVRVRTTSDYWLYASLFSSTCPIALLDGQVVGAIVAFRSQDDPDDVYIQDVMVHPDHRQRGIAHALLAHVRQRATDWACQGDDLQTRPARPSAKFQGTGNGPAFRAR